MNKRDKSSDETLRQCVVLRLPRYYHYIRDHVLARGDAVVSSAEVGSALGIDDTMVRHDLASIGVKGKAKVGFSCNDVLEAVRSVLGYEVPMPALLVGAGRLGGAIASYRGFTDYGLILLGVFDNDEEKHGTTVAGLRVQAIEKIPAFASDNAIRLGVIATPAQAAQSVAELLVESGIKAIWNFAPTQIAVPGDVMVQYEMLSVGLSALSYFLRNHSED